MKHTKIVILVTTDVHGQISPYHYVNRQYVSKGLAKAASVIHDIRETEENVILLDNGDLIQGTPLAHYALTKSKTKNPMIQIHNLIQYDAAVLGNHEFNYGRRSLEKVVQESRFPWLSANVVKEGTREPYFGKPYITKRFGNVKVSILGLTTKYIPKWESKTNIEKFGFLDPVEAGKYWVKRIKQEEKSDVVIVSYHGGLEKHPETLETISPNDEENQGFSLLEEIPDIDVLITGHQHLLYDITMKAGKIVLQAGAQAAYVGKIELLLKNNRHENRIEKNHVELIPTKDYPADSEVLQNVQDIENKTDQWLGEKIGIAMQEMRIDDPLHDVWLREHPLIEWINKTLMKVGHTEIACTPLLNTAKFVIKKCITRRDIYALYPFPNTLAVLALSGNDIREALEVSASFLTIDEHGKVRINPEWEKPRFLSYNYDMWEGIEYTIDVKRPVGKRLLEASFKGVPLSDEIYYVATSSYRASGSGGYEMFGPAKMVKEIHLDIVELLVSELQKEKILTSEVNHNWNIRY